MTPKALIAPARLAGAPMLRSQTDERLVDLVRAGNDAAFEAIVARYRRPLLRYCSRLLGEARADDAVQGAFLRAYDGLHASGREMHLRPWLFRIAHNVALNALRERGARHEQLSEQLDGVERPDQAFERRENMREVVAAVAMLPARQRDAIVLRELEGRSYEEIAASLGVTGGAVRQLLNRARTTLRAGVTSVTPFGLLSRVPWAPGWGGDAAGRTAELCGGAAGGAVAVKACATVLVTGAIVGGMATAPPRGEESAGAAAAERATETRSAGGSGGDDQPSAASARAHEPASRRGPSAGERQRSGEDGRSGSGDAGSSGPDDGGSESSGPGSGSDSSGSGSSGSGSDSSGSGSTRSGSSGSGSSGSGSSGSGSGSSGSGSPGSGSSGSESDSSGDSGSGSGSGDDSGPSGDSGSETAGSLSGSSGSG